MLGLNPYIWIGAAIFLVILTGGAYAKGRVDAGKKYEKQVGGLELANKTFADQEIALRAKAEKTETEKAEAERITGMILDRKGDTIIRLNAAPIGPGCDGALQFLRDEAARAQAARKKFNETRSR